jgi:hypothetical protein
LAGCLGGAEQDCLAVWVFGLDVEADRRLVAWDTHQDVALQDAGVLRDGLENGNPTQAPLAAHPAGNPGPEGACPSVLQAAELNPAAWEDALVDVELLVQSKILAAARAL